MYARLRLHDPGQRVPGAPAGRQDSAQGARPRRHGQETVGRHPIGHLPRTQNHVRTDQRLHRLAPPPPPLHFVCTQIFALNFKYFFVKLQKVSLHPPSVECAQRDSHSFFSSKQKIGCVSAFFEFVSECVSIFETVHNFLDFNKMKNN